MYNGEIQIIFQVNRLIKRFSQELHKFTAKILFGSQIHGKFVSIVVYKYILEKRVENRRRRRGTGNSITFWLWVFCVCCGFRFQLDLFQSIKVRRSSKCIKLSRRTNFVCDLCSNMPFNRLGGEVEAIGGWNALINEENQAVLLTVTESVLTVSSFENGVVCGRDGLGWKSAVAVRIHCNVKTSRSRPGLTSGVANRG